jgi:hypothetical protein
MIQHGTCDTPVWLCSSWMLCTTSEYGAASLTKRSPWLLTISEPGVERSVTAKFG